MKFEELNLNNAFMFAVAMSDKTVSSLIMEIILEQPVPDIIIQTEHSILYNSDFYSIRLDVYATDVVQVDYNVEMQNESERSLPKRCRFYQAQMDVTSLKPLPGTEHAFW